MVVAVDYILQRSKTTYITLKIFQSLFFFINSVSLHIINFIFYEWECTIHSYFGIVWRPLISKTPHFTFCFVAYIISFALICLLWYMCCIFCFDNYYIHDDYSIALFLSIFVKLKFLFLQYFKLLKLFPYHYCSDHSSLLLLWYTIYLALIIVILICYFLKTLHFFALINHEPFWTLLQSVDIA